MKYGILLLAAAALLSACSYDSAPDVEKGVRPISLVQARLSRNDEEAPAKPNAAQLAQTALNSKIPGTLLLATTVQTGDTTVLAEWAKNGDYTTFATPTRQSVTLRHGIVTATRGLGYDLMSAELGQTTHLIKARKSGAAGRIHTYLTVEGVERVIGLNCTISRGNDQNLPKPTGGAVKVTVMQETCGSTSGAITSQSIYLVDGHGAIQASNQWVGPEYGNLNLQVLRR